MMTTGNDPARSLLGTSLGGVSAPSPKPPPKPPPGWYPDPSGASLQQYWDGNEWAPQSRASPQPSKDQTARTILIVLGAVAVAAVLGLVFASHDNHSSSSSTSSTTTHSEMPQPASADTPTTTAPPLPLPTPDEFKINVIVIKQDCFGSAGCNVQYEINPDYTGPSAQLKNRSLRIIYQINGGDNPKTASFTVVNGTAHYDKSGFISTVSADVNITATATQVIPEQ
jgi:hypothetical protein